MSSADRPDAERECRACADLRYRRVARAVADGASIAEAARAARIERQSIYRHRAQCRDFRERLRRVRRIAANRDRPLIFSLSDYIDIASENIERRVDDTYELDASYAYTPAPLTRSGWSAIRRRSQQHIVEYIAEHPSASIAEAAAAAREKPATVRSWSRREPEFNAAIKRARQRAPQSAASRSRD